MASDDADNSDAWVRLADETQKLGRPHGQDVLMWMREVSRARDEWQKTAEMHNDQRKKFCVELDQTKKDLASMRGLYQTACEDMRSEQRKNIALAAENEELRHSLDKSIDWDDHKRIMDAQNKEIDELVAENTGLEKLLDEQKTEIDGLRKKEAELDDAKTVAQMSDNIDGYTDCIGAQYGNLGAWLKARSESERRKALRKQDPEVKKLRDAIKDHRDWMESSRDCEPVEVRKRIFTSCISMLDAAVDDALGKPDHVTLTVNADTMIGGPKPLTGIVIRRDMELDQLLNEYMKGEELPFSPLALLIEKIVQRLSAK